MNNLYINNGKVQKSMDVGKSGKGEVLEQGMPLNTWEESKQQSVVAVSRNLENSDSLERKNITEMGA